MTHTTTRSAWFNRANATAILEANDTGWDGRLIDIYDALAEAGWDGESCEDAIEAWAC